MKITNTLNTKIIITDIKMAGKSVLADIIDLTDDESISKLTIQPGESLVIDEADGDEVWWLES